MLTLFLLARRMTLNLWLPSAALFGCLSLRFSSALPKLDPDPDSFHLNAPFTPHHAACLLAATLPGPDPRLPQMTAHIESLVLCTPAPGSQWQAATLASW